MILKNSISKFTSLPLYIIILIAIALFNSIYNGFIPLHPDEAYYWVWSQNLSLSYFDHPPMIAYMIKLFTLFGSSEFSVRLVNVFCMTVSGFFIYKLSKIIYGEKSALYALIIFAFIPLTNVGYLVTTPDSPLILFWTMTVYFMYLYIYEKKTQYAYLGGLTAGFALLSKYTGVLIFPSIFLYLISFHDGRKKLLQPPLYISFIISLLTFLPVIIWNSRNNWISFLFQFNHGVSNQKIFNLNTLLEFLGGQMLLVTPIIFISLVYYVFRPKYIIASFKNKTERFLLIIFLFPLLFFIYNSMFKKAEANWAAPAYITGITLISNYIYINRKRILFFSIIAFSLLLIILVKFPDKMTFLPRHLVLKSFFYGNNEIFQPLKSKFEEHNDFQIYSDSYQNASLVWFYLRPENVRIITKSRFSNYDLWNKNYNYNKMGLFITDSEAAHQDMYNYFTEITLISELKYKNHFVEKEYKVFLCENPNIIVKHENENDKF